jgi:preprotein translocase subunit SecD
VNYLKESPRDPANPITMISLRPVDSNAKNISNAVLFPRLTFRFVTDDPAIPADELVDPTDKGGKRTLRLSREVVLDEGSVAMVDPSRLASDPPRLGVGLEMTEAGAKKLEQITGNNIGQKLAIVLDGQILIAPNIQSKIGKHVLITSGTDRESAELLGRIHAAVFSLPELKK